jgi:hypothetical protein
MQIGGPNLLVAAQTAPQPGADAKAAATPSFEPLTFAKVSVPIEERNASAPPGPIQRPGAQVDIKV